MSRRSQNPESLEAAFLQWIAGRRNKRVLLLLAGCVVIAFALWSTLPDGTKLEILAGSQDPQTLSHDPRVSPIINGVQIEQLVVYHVSVETLIIQMGDANISNPQLDLARTEESLAINTPDAVHRALVPAGPAWVTPQPAGRLSPMGMALSGYRAQILGAIEVESSSFTFDLREFVPKKYAGGLGHRSRVRWTRSYTMRRIDPDVEGISIGSFWQDGWAGEVDSCRSTTHGFAALYERSKLGHHLNFMLDVSSEPIGEPFEVEASCIVLDPFSTSEGEGGLHDFEAIADLVPAISIGQKACWIRVLFPSTSPCHSMLLVRSEVGAVDHWIMDFQHVEHDGGLNPEGTEFSALIRKPEPGKYIVSGAMLDPE